MYTHGVLLQLVLRPCSKKCILILPEPSYRQQLACGFLCLYHSAVSKSKRRYQYLNQVSPNSYHLHALHSSLNKRIYVRLSLSTSHLSTVVNF